MPSYGLKRIFLIIVAVVIAVAIPLFVWAILTGNFDIRKRASGEPSPTPIATISPSPTSFLMIQDSFDGPGSLDLSKWGWVGYTENSVLLENGQLKAVVPSGQLTGGPRNSKSVWVTTRSNCQVAEVVGDFDVKVDLVKVVFTGGSAYQELSFAGDSGVSIRRYNNGSSEKLEAVTTNGSILNNVVTSIDLPANTGVVRVQLIKTGTSIQMLYSLGGNLDVFTSLATITPSSFPGTIPNEGLLGLSTYNDQPDYPQVMGYFDNFAASGNFRLGGAACTGSPSPSPAPSPTPRPTCRPRPSCLDATPRCLMPVTSDMCPPATPSPTPRPTCRPRPSCLDATPRCLIPVTSNMCPPTSSPSPTPQPTPTPSVKPLILRVKVKFAGVSDDRADGAKITLRFKNNFGVDLETSPAVVNHIGNGVYEAILTPSNSIPALEHYVVIVKGEKHLGKKFCLSSGQISTFRCGSSASITIPSSGEITLDFSGIALEPGDLPDQDGKADANDFAKIKTLMSKLCSDLTESDKLVADLDYNGCINVKDAFLMRKTLETRYDEE